MHNIIIFMHIYIHLHMINSILSIGLIHSDDMSKLWSTLKSVVSSSAPIPAPEVVSAAAATLAKSDGMLQGFAAIKPHSPLIKFRFCILYIILIWNLSKN